MSSLSKNVNWTDIGARFYTMQSNATLGFELVSRRRPPPRHASSASDGHRNGCLSQWLRSWLMTWWLRLVHDWDSSMIQMHGSMIDITETTKITLSPKFEMLDCSSAQLSNCLGGRLHCWAKRLSTKSCELLFWEYRMFQSCELIKLRLQSKITGSSTCSSLRAQAQVFEWERLKTLNDDSL